ncbi:hypothetical protein B296_00016173 [Ensete ventricosum]|uniref:Uncharacterized protein n=1 Tax=Ensete ventricosum TaxID=4639 RepID=A0A427A9B4_ENSVE|nr:hypothetical protein B296_00016173 [Ensete ventricosum]
MRCSPVGFSNRGMLPMGEGLPIAGWLPMAKPPTGAQQGKGVADHGQVLCKGGWFQPRLRGQSLAKGSCPRHARKGLPPTASPAASRGDSVNRNGGRPLAGWLPTARGCHR